ncbi:hypothetical protein AVG20_004552, partial [Salmonella enterica subsp. enterica serovar Paratyphi A]|nr:hypothetical protein [Salmonella enterica subsp. enterica serovar Paratyphi A]
MSSHDRLRIGLAKTCQNWRAFAHVMQVHENHYIKRAGVAGIRARAQRLTLGPKSLQAKKLTFIFQLELS